MSIIFGVRKSEEDLVTEQDLLHLGHTTDRYALDGTSVHSRGRVGMGFQPYHTHERSRLECGPSSDNDTGNMLGFDGRLDNHKELCSLLNIAVPQASDSVIVLAAFARWGESCFARLTGDWALALWCHNDRALYLARDHAGSRTLYYEITKDTLLWTSHLETFFADTPSRTLDETYAAGYLACLPTGNLTPYRGIRSVPPAHYLRFRDDNLLCQPHWTWMVREQISYRSDVEYDEHFLSLFKQSIKRRTIPGAPVIAQLSGGVDSTAIVCVSDAIRREQGVCPEDLLDTISFYDDSEPTWDEKPYFMLVERQRGKVGHHVPASFLKHTYKPHEGTSGIYRLPGQDSYTIEAERDLYQLTEANGYRVVLSGIGGDEVLGGVPNALPELSDLLMCGDLRALCQRSFAWSLPTRKPLIRLIAETIAFTYETYRGDRMAETTAPPWLNPSQLTSLLNQGTNISDTRSLGLRPSAICNGATWWTILDTLPHLSFTLLPSCEYRYPYLDKDLVDFLFRIPRTQIIQPGRRRLLMRRALKGIVPSEVLERPRKAYLLRGPLSSLQHAEAPIRNLFRAPRIAGLGLVNLPNLNLALETLLKGADTCNFRSLTRAIALELWLRSIDNASGPIIAAA
ncbi:asparagine synthetase B family protein [Granulicella sibirica]|uniref:asparagine synthase (glutamine-hydrolyzing) n=1 Tax=Granulicella sibirica TaxID=2479048 RepID=A0A4Q0SWR8_9BACT|nr:asparagine synthase-related protein [Granulicella sibirica]RXH53879.1 Asparagine synthetase [glutamine-hydrolyzing] [Granulicella sibirica]